MADMILGQHPLLKKPFLERRFKDLTERKFVADSLFTKSTSDSLAIKFLMDADRDSNGVYGYDEVPEVGEGSGYRRVGLSEEARVAFIKKYGLEMAFSYEMQRFGSEGQFERGFRKLSQSVIKAVNDMAYDTIRSNPDILTRTKTGATGDVKWSDFTNGCDQMVSDIVDAKNAGAKAGYTYDTMVVSTKTHGVLVKNPKIREAVKKNNQDIAFLDGYIGSVLGLDIIVDINYPDNEVLILERGIIGDIADADGGLRTLTYDQQENDTTILRATRFVTCYLTDPKGVYLLKNID